MSTNKREQDRARINEQITVPEVRLIDANGDQRGIVPAREAIRLADEAGLDLVEISPNASPPVCKIMNYGKYLFELDKRAADAKKKNRQINVKELKFRPTTDEGDYQVKLRNLIRFLNHGDKVKITIRFRGRELVHRELGMELIERLQRDIAEYGVVEQTAKQEGRQLMMVLSPKKKQ